jgi:hypothetical protein
MRDDVLEQAYFNDEIFCISMLLYYNEDIIQNMIIGINCDKGKCLLACGIPQLRAYVPMMPTPRNTYHFLAK